MGGGCPWHPGPRHIGAAPHGASCLLSPLRTGTLRPWACPRGRKLVWDLAGSTLVLFLSPATGSCLREQFQEVGDSKLSLVSWKPLKGSWAHTQERRETRAAASYTLSPSLMPLFCDPYLKTKTWQRPQRDTQVCVPKPHSSRRDPTRPVRSPTWKHLVEAGPGLGVPQQGLGGEDDQLKQRTTGSHRARSETLQEGRLPGAVWACSQTGL